MSVVVVGGNDRMAARYKDICREYNCKAKVFTQMPSDFEKQLGSPNLMVVFTDTVSRKMARVVNRRSERGNIPVVRIHNAGAAALKKALDSGTEQLLNGKE